MTLSIYTGTPGSGKSLHATRDIRDYLKYKKTLVIANFQIRSERKWNGVFEYVKNSDLNTDYLISRAIDFWHGKNFKEDGILLVLDECQLLFNSRSWMDADRMGWIEFLSQHRKYGYKIIFVTQFDQMIDKQIRALVEYEVTHRKFSNFGLFGKVLSMFVPGQPFIAVTRFYSMKQRLGSEWFFYSKRIARMYNSYGKFEQKKGQAAGVQALPAGLPPAVSGAMWYDECKS